MYNWPKPVLLNSFTPLRRLWTGLSHLIFICFTLALVLYVLCFQKVDRSWSINSENKKKAKRVRLRFQLTSDICEDKLPYKDFDLIWILENTSNQIQLKSWHKKSFKIKIRKDLDLIWFEGQYPMHCLFDRGETIIIIRKHLF